MTRIPLIVALSGASGSSFALRLLYHLGQLQVPVDLMVSRSAETVLRQEVSAETEWMQDGLPAMDAFGLADCDARGLASDDFMTSAASGSARSLGMVIVPCSMGTVGRLAAGVSQSLIERAGDVCIKEGRKLVIVPRETPLSVIHLENLLKLSRAGVVCLPASPGYYHRPESLTDLADGLAARILDQLGIEHSVGQRWKEQR
jgi:4-hydroxy-3-polyprenylbenzoate decarboxylase